MYYLAETVLSTLHIFSHFLIIWVICSEHNYFHLTGNSFKGLAELLIVPNGARICIRFFLNLKAKCLASMTILTLCSLECKYPCNELYNNSYGLTMNVFLRLLSSWCNKLYVRRALYVSKRRKYVNGRTREKGEQLCQNQAIWPPLLFCFALRY